MEVCVIRAMCLDSAQRYYDFLKANDKGFQEVTVHEIIRQPNSDDCYRLRLAAKLFDSDSVFIKLLSTGQMYDTTQINIIEYNVDSNLLVIRPPDELLAHFSSLRHQDIIIVSDLRFLIKRIYSWYERNGAMLALPVKQSPLYNTLSTIQFLDAYPPSDHQQKALQAVFTHPFSYIWGAPGTGKTQFVLAYAILHYLRHHKRVAVLAPTNNAIEQVLRGVLFMTDAAGIDRASTILRLGTPSAKFAEEFPEVCEHKGIEKKIEGIKSHIRKIQCQISLRKIREVVDTPAPHLALFDTLSSLFQQQEQAGHKLEECKKTYAKVKGIIDALEMKKTTVWERCQTYRTRSQTLFRRIVRKILQRPITTDRLLQQAEEELTRILEQKAYQELELTARVSALKQLQNEVQLAAKQIKEAIAHIQNTFAAIPTLASALEKLQPDNSSTIRKLVQDSIEELQKKFFDNSTYSEHSNYSLQELSSLLQQYQDMMAHFSLDSTDERLKDVKVIACTLDGYIGRFAETKMEVDHIFLDEAAYASLIKALTLFNHDVPITFLGDHMQLHPVCEIDNRDIQRNALYRNVFLWSQSALFLEGVFLKPPDKMLHDYLSNAPLTLRNMHLSNLMETYRFGKSLAEVLSREVYPTGFHSANSKGETRILYAHAAKRKEDYKSRESLSEVHAIKRIVALLDTEDYVILTPYKSQLRLLCQHLSHQRNTDRILTVHGSQGREWDTVIISIVDTNNKWFTDSQNSISRGLHLLNTGVSRARRHLILVCDTGYWLAQPDQLVMHLLSVGSQISFS